MEEWRDILDWEGRYQVSSEGRVRSADRTTNVILRGVPLVYRFKGKVLCPTPDSGGYLTVSLSDCGKKTTKMVHELVCSAFHGVRPKGLTAAHGNGVQYDNREDNLRWATYVENEHDKKLHGTYYKTPGRAHLEVAM